MITQDLHIHTHLSSCGDRLAFISDYAEAAKAKGLKTIGFADHAWDQNVKGASDWYAPQTFNRLAARYDEVKKIDAEGIKILLGAEGEFADMLLGVSEAATEFVDYILIPHSHTHMKGFVLPSRCDTPEKHGKYLVDSFIALCGHEKRNLFFGIVHPMCPIGKNSCECNEIYNYISEEMLLECAQAAKEASVALELNLSCVKHLTASDGEEIAYKRFFDACKRVGCKFFLGSDAHSINAFNSLHENPERAISLMGLSESDFIIEEPRKPIL